LSPQTQTKIFIAPKVSAENNLRRESLTKGNVSKCYKNVIHWLKDHTSGVKIIVEAVPGMCLDLPCKVSISLDKTHHATKDRVKSKSQMSN
jgi:hypothetical protein